MAGHQPKFGSGQFSPMSEVNISKGSKVLISPLFPMRVAKFENDIKWVNERRRRNSIIVLAFLSMAILSAIATMLFLAASKMQTLGLNADLYKESLELTTPQTSSILQPDLQTEYVSSYDVRIPRDVKMEAKEMNAGNQTERTTDGTTPLLKDLDLDETEFRRQFAEKMVSYMDVTADPCQDFYQYACGHWGDNHPIPGDREGIDTFSLLRENQLTILQQLLMEADKNDSEAVGKAKTLYRSCMNTERLKESTSLLMSVLESLGGWPVLSSSWNSSSFDLGELIIKLQEYGGNALVSFGVVPDLSESASYIILFNQAKLSLAGKDYYLQEQHLGILEAYKEYFIKIARLLGADEITAAEDADNLIIFEKQIATICASTKERRNVSGYYEKLSLVDLEKNISSISWRRYLEGSFGHELNSSTIVAMIARKYYNQLTSVIEVTKPRTVANFLIWRFVMYRVQNLGEQFQLAEQDLQRVISGREEMPARWKYCVNNVHSQMGMAIASMFVTRYFDESSKKDVMDMTDGITYIFKKMLNEIDWFDEETRQLSLEKVREMIIRVAYPDFILDPQLLSKHYENVTIEENQYFENSLNLIKNAVKAQKDRLGTAVNKTEWGTLPALVNAFYSHGNNAITIPAGILQPPFYHRYLPHALNFGGIGVVIAHEMTHGFDDIGRLFDRKGNMHQWWKEEAIEGFKERVKCLIDQYNNFTVKGINVKADGLSTLGENIADNGAIKQAFEAYEKWLFLHGDTEKSLPIANTSNHQLFFINFAQIWCGTMHPESSRRKIETEPHSLGRFRVIGTLSNSEEFNKVFNCPKGAAMNSEEKCRVW